MVLFHGQQVGIFMALDVEQFIKADDLNNSNPG